MASRTRSRKRWPDAFLVNEETIEVALQTIAAGGRAAMLARGNPITDGVESEDRIASAPADDPEVPLILEASSLSGTGRPSPPRVLDLPTVIVGRTKSTCPQRIFRNSALRTPVRR